MSDKIYIDTVGLVITLDCGTTVSGATNTSVEVKKPNGSTTSWSATASGDDLIVTIVDGDLDVAGVYYLQSKCTIGSFTGRGKTDSLEIYKNFE